MPVNKSYPMALALNPTPRPASSSHASHRTRVHPPPLPLLPPPPRCVCSASTCGTPTPPPTSTRSRRTGGPGTSSACGTWPKSSTRAAPTSSAYRYVIAGKHVCGNGILLSSSGRFVEANGVAGCVRILRSDICSRSVVFSPNSKLLLTSFLPCLCGRVGGAV